MYGFKVSLIMFRIFFFTLCFIFLGAQAQTITNFRFTAEAVGWNENFVGAIDQKNLTITFTTQKWIENIAQLPAIFELDGDYEVRVGGTVQKSGTTTNDFRKDVVYTVNGNVHYTVQFISPQASGLPVIKIETKNGAAITSKVDYINMTFVLNDPNIPANNISKTDMTDQIRGRGNDSWNNPNAKKKSYRVKFDKKTSFFGLTSAKSWVLIAQYRDATLLYNTIAFELGDRFAFPFNHSYHFVELYLNRDYKGNYLLTEQNQVNPGRVDINENEGWLVEMDGYYDEEPKFRTNKYELPVMIKSPEFEPIVITNPAYNFVINEVNALTNAVSSSDFPENGYRNLLNMNTFIDFMMISEICDNKDFQHPMSTLMYKDKGSLINMGPLWDFDCGYGYGYNYIHFGSPNTRTPMNSFFKKLFEDPVFLMGYKERWNEKYNDIVSMPDFMDGMAMKLKKSADQNFQTWWYRTYAPWTNDHPYEPNNFLNSISLIKKWYVDHAAYLHSELNKIEVLPKSITFANQSFNYSDVAPQIITLVAYDDITNLSARLQKAESSDFEIAAGLSKTPAGKGGYWATISVKPKKSLPQAKYSDVLILSGTNQRKSFSFELPLSFSVVEFTNAQTPEIVEHPQDVTVRVSGNVKLSVVAKVTDGGTLHYQWFSNTSPTNTGGRGIIGATNATYSPTTSPVGKYYYYVRVINYNSRATDEQMVTAWSNAATVTVVQITSENTPTANTLKAWARNGQLHVNGLIPDKTWSVFNTSGALVYQSIATSDEADIPLRVQGTYIVQSGNHTVKVMVE